MVKEKEKLNLMIDDISDEGVDFHSIEPIEDLEDDDNFDQKTVAKRGTLQAARIVLRPKVISNLVQDGGRKAVTRTFVMEMADIKTGLIMWKYTKQLGFMKEKGTFGW